MKGYQFQVIKRWLPYPLTKGLDLDDPRLTELRTRVIREKVFLNRIYREWYHLISKNLPPVPGPILELGSGAGFLGEYIPGVITSEVFHCSSVRMVMDGRYLPFEQKSLRAIVMTDVFHHIPEARSFFTEAERCLQTGGAVIMIEPWATTWSRMIYNNIHHEPFITSATQWEFPSAGPLSSANGALPWIVFHRDRAQFEKEFPGFSIEIVRPFMPIRYLVSGGFAWRSFTPGWSFPFWTMIEKVLQPLMRHLAMFALIKVVRNHLVRS